MPVREFLEKHSKLAIGISLAGIILFGIVIGFQLRGGGASHLPVFSNRQFYTTDDGATWFADDSVNIPPYDHDGKQAVIAYVFSCDGGKNAFVQFMEKYTDKARQQLTSPANAVSNGVLLAKLVKRPGDKVWLSETSPQGLAMMKPRCPDGATGLPTLLAP